MSKLFSEEVVETCLCIMEVLCEVKHPKIERHRENVGASQFRRDIMTDLAPKIEKAYQTAIKILGPSDLCFDLDFIPSVMEEMIQRNGGMFADQCMWVAASLHVLSRDL